MWEGDVSRMSDFGPSEVFFPLLSLIFGFLLVIMRTRAEGGL